MATKLTVPVLDYRLIRHLGEGVTSDVWLADPPAANGPVALKVARSAAHEACLADEAQRLLFADSPHLAAVLDAGRLKRALDAPDGRTLRRGAAYVALTWIDGEPLSPEQLTKGERIELAYVVARDVGLALADLHASGTVHGDVKPANILIQARGREARATLIDLGLGSEVGATSPRGGTLRYLSPEFLATTDPSDAAARDLWALGVTLIEIASPDAVTSDRPWERLATVEEPMLRRMLAALLAPSPSARALPGWIARRAAERRPAPAADTELVTRRIAAVRRSYLALRRSELAAAAHARTVHVAVAGAPGDWLRNALELERRVAGIRGRRRSDDVSLAELGSYGRTRWLVRLIGASAADWTLPATSDAGLAERLTELSRRHPLEAITLAALTHGAYAPESVPNEPVALALELATARPRAATLDRTEALVLSGRCPPALGIALGRTLRLRGETARALTVLAALASPAAAVEAAEAARRARDPVGCRSWLARAEGLEEPELASRWHAIAARVTLDAGDTTGALARLANAPESAATLEVEALAAAARGDRQGALRRLERAASLARGHEDRARVTGVRAMLEHASGALSASLASFRQAVGHAAEAGAVLEEATYLTGVAAAAARGGHLAEALDAAGRSALLFEHLGRPAEAARALLTRAAVYAELGAYEETQEAARDALGRARAVGDRRCQAYVHLALCDVIEEGPAALEHAQRALALLKDATPEEQLRAEARVLRHGGTVDLVNLEALARDEATALDARLEWWGARATALLTARQTEGAAAVVAEIAALAPSAGLPSVAGPTLASGAALAASVGDGEGARRMTQAAAECAHELLPRVPPELRPRLSARPWVSAAIAEPTPLAPAQIADLETLARALSGRQRLRPLLDQALDALVLWTGVERGLLLLRAPGGRLVPRAARNLQRDDLVGVQLELSHTLAERAMAEREPVVAVDASGELSTVHQSVHALRLRSVLAVPLVSRGDVLGVVYLDDRVRRGAFGPRELAWVRLVATLAALAIADARDQLSLRRAVRRAQRAERHVAEQLAQREVALAVAERALAQERDARDTRHAYEDFVGTSAAMRDLLRMVDRVTEADVPVLIAGESGSGKDLVARAIHRNGARSRQAFVTENCSAIPDALLESALFGHVRGAFTGADRARAGLFDAADGGTLFLDEIGEMSLVMQAKLLRVLETGEIRPVGSDRTRRVDVRVLAATHRDLRRLVADGRFREDLLYRLDVITVRVPALRERSADIDLLVRHFLAKHAGGRAVRVDPAALSALRRHPWPGNVRQLENELRRALVLCDETITLSHLSPTLAPTARTAESSAPGLDVRQRVDALERELVREALSRTQGNQTRAALLLGLSRFGLQKMMRRLEVQVDVATPDADERSH